MNTKGTSIEFVRLAPSADALVRVPCHNRLRVRSPDLLQPACAAEGPEDIDSPAAFSALASGVFFADALSQTQAPRSFALPVTAGRPRDFWETLSYLILQLCGLAGIGLCFT